LDIADPAAVDPDVVALRVHFDRLPAGHAGGIDHFLALSVEDVDVPVVRGGEIDGVAAALPRDRLGVGRHRLGPLRPAPRRNGSGAHEGSARASVEYGV